jgi:hypothetical protein
LGKPQAFRFNVALATVYFGRVNVPPVEVSADTKVDGAHTSDASAPVRWPKQHHVGVVGEEGTKIFRSWNITAVGVALEPILLLPKAVHNLNGQVRVRLSGTADQSTDDDKNEDGATSVWDRGGSDGKIMPRTR